MYVTPVIKVLIVFSELYTGGIMYSFIVNTAKQSATHKMCKKSYVSIVHFTTFVRFYPFMQCLFYVSLRRSMKTHTFRSKPELIAILVIAFFCFMAANCHSSSAKTADINANSAPGAAKPEGDKTASSPEVKMPDIEGMKVA